MDMNVHNNHDQEIKKTQSIYRDEIPKAEFKRIPLLGTGFWINKKEALMWNKILKVI